MTSHAGGLAASVYFITLVIVGAFYIPNLFLAVMWHIYSTTHGCGSHPDPRSCPPLLKAR